MGALTQTSECIPIGSDPECTKIPSHKAPPPEKQQFCKKNKKEIARRNRTNDHQTATTDNHGQ